MPGRKFQNVYHIQVSDGFEADDYFMSTERIAAVQALLVILRSTVQKTSSKSQSRRGK